MLYNMVYISGCYCALKVSSACLGFSVYGQPTLYCISLDAILSFASVALNLYLIERL